MNNWVKLFLGLAVGWAFLFFLPWDDWWIGFLILRDLLQGVLVLVSGVWLYCRFFKSALPKFNADMTNVHWFLLWVIFFIFVGLAILGVTEIVAQLASIQVIIAMGVLAVVSLVGMALCGPALNVRLLEWNR